MQWWQQNLRVDTIRVVTASTFVLVQQCAKRIWANYIHAVYLDGLQNYSITQQLAKKFVKRAKKRKMKVSTIEPKRRRRELIAKRRQKNTTLKVREDSTYQSDISLIDTIDITEILPHIPVPEEKNVSNGKYTLVSVDVETVSFGECDIVPLSSAAGTSHFDSYVVPSQQIPRLRNHNATDDGNLEFRFF